MLQDKFNAFDYNRRLGQALNLGNALEAPAEGQWGLELQEWHFASIADGGYDSIRVPIRWSVHADQEAPYAIDESFFQRVDWVVDQAQRNNLAVILNMHHYNEFYEDVVGHSDRFNQLWGQIAERYQNEPTTSVFFELLNEPRQSFTHLRWRNVVSEALDVVRQTNPDRMVIVGGINYNTVTELARLRLPEDDPNLIGTFHYYDPFSFTHQGAEWVDGSSPWLGTKWSGSPEQEAAVEAAFGLATDWSERFGRPVLLGEFGSYWKADLDSRAKWTEFVLSQAEQRGFAWSYWEFAAGFGVMDTATRQWVDPLYRAMAPTSLLNLDGREGVTLADVDLLSKFIADGSKESLFDLDGSGQVDTRDLDFWVYFTGNKLGDADLNGEVEFLDFVTLSGNFGDSGTWSDGDFNADGLVDFRDFVILVSDSKATDASQAAVPEPTANNGLIWIVVCLTVLRSRGKRPNRWKLRHAS